MNFEFTEEQLMIQQAARDYAQRELIKDVIERDNKAEFPTEHVKNLADLGFMGIMVDPKYDGSGMDGISYVLAMEELSKVDGSASVIVSVNNSLVCFGLEAYGSEEIKEKYLKPLARGEVLGAFLLSEPEAGSDATSQSTTAEDKGDYYLLNGTKNWITNANSASIYVVIAQTHPEKRHKGINAFVIEKNTPGITLGPHEDKMGMRSSDTHSVMFNDVKVPKENRIGEDGFGFKFAMKVLEGGRIGIAAQALGLASGALERATAYAKERKAFGTEIGNHQAIAFKLSDMAVKVENARNLCIK
ncbi:MAG: acyl-CoA dehydrogenase family protein, partial [Bacteroidales bacterium]|nr:acyl-CoA dehydrogenase family protein [Bacteroidales bacterium]